MDKSGCEWKNAEGCLWLSVSPAWFRSRSDFSAEWNRDKARQARKADKVRWGAISKGGGRGRNHQSEIFIMKAVRGNLYCIVNADVKLFPPLSLSHSLLLAQTFLVFGYYLLSLPVWDLRAYDSDTLTDRLVRTGNRTQSTYNEWHDFLSILVKTSLSSFVCADVKGQGHPSSGSSGSSLFARDNRPDASKMKYIPADNSLSQLPERESQQRLWHSTKHTSTTQYVHSAAESTWQSAITAKTPSRDSDWLRGVKCIFLEHSTGGFVCFYPPFRAF